MIVKFEKLKMIFKYRTRCTIVIFEVECLITGKGNMWSNQRTEIKR